MAKRVAPTDSKIKLGIRSQDGDVLYFLVFEDKKLESLFKNYCERKNLEYATVTFLCNGERIKPTKTPIQLGLEEEEIIDAMVHQTGGGFGEVKK